MAAISRAPAGRGQGRGLSPGRSSTRGDLSELEDAGGARGRFLKGQRCPRGGSGPAAPGSASHTRLCSVLHKVAQLESKIMGHKKQLELQKPDSGLKEDISSCSSGHEGGARGKRCWRKSHPTRGTRRDSCSEQEESIQRPERNVPVKQQLGVDSEEEEMRELLERSLGFSSGNGNQKVLDKGSEGGVFSPSAISRSLAGHTRRSPLTSSMKNNTLKVALPKAGCSKQRQESLGSDRSEIKSLDELFSEGADAEDANSSSSEDFRLNILSLDDLAPDSSSEAAELKQQGKEIQFAPESKKDVKKETLLMGEEQADFLSSAVSDSPEEDIEEFISEAEISEHLSGASSAPPPHNQARVQQPDRTPHSQYSEDLESSVCAEEEEEEAESCPSPAGEPRGQRGPGGAAELPPPPPPPPAPAAPPCSSCGARANPSAAAAGASPEEPVPIATHLLSPEAPQALLLHSLCKQHLLLTQSFIHNVQQLHSALLQSLDREQFHYHSLQEAKEYIRNHKSPPLTMEQALEEIQRSQEKELNWK